MTRIFAKRLPQADHVSAGAVVVCHQGRDDAGVRLLAAGGFG
jgi:hypothetical protein